jgi:hypothetical protein
MRAREFVERLRVALTELYDWEDALVFLELLLSHPTPPTQVEESIAQIWKAIYPRCAQSSRAKLLRSAADGLRRGLGDNPLARQIAILLLDQAILSDGSPSARMVLVDSWVTSADLAALSRRTMVPRLVIASAVEPTAVSIEQARSMLELHTRIICRVALVEFTAGAHAFHSWHPADLRAALFALRCFYANSVSGLIEVQRPSAQRADEFLEVGKPLWQALRWTAASRREEVGRSIEPLDEEWHNLAQARMLLAIRSGSLPLQEEPIAERSGTAPSPLDLVVCRHPIPAAADRFDKEEIGRHLVLEQPLPLKPMPSARVLQDMQSRLTVQFPWARGVLDTIFGELIGRSQLGVTALGMPPTLLVGPAGSGKSRLAKQIALELDLPSLDVPLGGISDSKVLCGTSRGWSSGRPSDMATLMASRKVASIMVLLDEIDKAQDNHRESGGIQAYLLGLLEPETVCRHSDVYLKTECDFSGVLWLATANRLSTISGPLMSRLRVLQMGQPRKEHFAVIAENVIEGLAKRWGLDRWVLPEVSELDLPLGQLSSARQVRVATEAAAASWARALQRH